MCDGEVGRWRNRAEHEWWREVKLETRRWHQVWVCSCGGQGSISLSGWCAGVWSPCRLCPLTCCHSHGCPGSEQQQNVWDRDRFVFWTGSPQKDLHVTCCHQRPCWYLWSVLPAEAMFVSVVHFTARGHIFIWPGLDCCLRPCGCRWSRLSSKAMFIPTVCAPTGGHVNVCGSWYHKGPVDVHGLCCCWGPWWCLWSMLWLRTLLMSVVCTVTAGHA